MTMPEPYTDDWLRLEIHRRLLNDHLQLLLAIDAKGTTNLWPVSIGREVRRMRRQRNQDEND